METPSQVFHASPKRNRESILNHGIDYRIHFGDVPVPENTRDVTYAPRANYLDESLDSLMSYYPEDRYDFYVVDTSGYKLRRDEAWKGGWTTRRRIPPDRISLLEI